MGRPKKQPNERRTERLSPRFTLAEKSQVQSVAAQAGLDPAEYLRRRALGYVVPSASTRRVDPAVINELNGIGVQLSSLGNVVNQIARYLHMERNVPDDWEHLPELIERSQQDVANALDVLLTDFASRQASKDEEAAE